MTSEVQIDAPKTDTPEIENSDNEVVIKETINIGETLKEKRVELGFDERKVATELKLPIDQVRALEANNFTYFRSTTFARGFLKSYCRLLDIDNSKLLSAFDDEFVSTESTIKPVDKIHKQTNLADPIVILVTIVIVAVLGFLVFWWPADTSVESLISDTLQGEEVEENNAPETPVLTESTADQTAEEPVKQDVVAKESVSEPVPVVTEPEPEPEAQEVVVAPESNANVVTGLSAETIAILEEAGVSPDEVVRATQEVPAPEPIVEEPAAVYLDDIEIAFIEDCWAEIRDANGTILFSGVKTANSTLTLTGNAPYRVVLGYAKAVSSFKFKGEEFDFAPFTRQDLARFELK